MLTSIRWINVKRFSFIESINDKDLDNKGHDEHVRSSRVSP